MPMRQRGAEPHLEELSSLLKEGKKVVCITGAGLSAASGLPTFRKGGQSQAWAVTSAARANRSCFLRDPLKWYNTFWLKHFPQSFMAYRPNLGHEAMAKLASSFKNLSVISQNIDGLELAARRCWPQQQQLIECHGRLGLYKCLTPDCPFSQAQTLDSTRQESTFNEWLSTNPNPLVSYDTQPSAILRGEVDGAVLTSPPLCPKCKAPVPPLALMFDEDYDSHSFYQFEDAQSLMADMKALMLVGTSRSVTITSLALAEAKSRGLPVFDFNLDKTLTATPALNVKHCMGKAEAMLPALVQAAGIDMGSDAAGRRPPAAPPAPSLLGGSPPSPPKAEAGSPPPCPASVATSHLKGGDTHAPPPALTYEIDPALPVLLGANQVTAVLSTSYNRLPHPERAVESKIDEFWERQMQEKQELFNATKFRLAGYTWDPIARSLQLHLGLTDYKTYIGTNWSAEAVPVLCADGLAHRGNPHAYLSQKLGNSGVVVSRDGFVVIINRSTLVCEGKGKVDVPGGHPEPANKNITPELLQGFSPSGAQQAQASRQAVEEIFGSVIGEVVDEINVPEATLSPPLLMGIVKQSSHCGAPVAQFLFSCSLTAAEIMDCYHKVQRHLSLSAYFPSLCASLLCCCCTQHRKLQCSRSISICRAASAVPNHLISCRITAPQHLFSAITITQPESIGSLWSSRGWTPTPSIEGALALFSWHRKEGRID
ncbi:unnamed protein product [Chrysoparadoxa australica]